MSEGFAYDAVRLVTTDGDLILDPFVRLQPELWDEDKKRLTLWMDPGKIKRGLMSNEKDATPLTPGKEIFITWLTGLGKVPMASHYKKVIINSIKQWLQIGKSPKLDYWQISFTQIFNEQPIGNFF